MTKNRRAKKNFRATGQKYTAARRLDLLPPTHAAVGLPGRGKSADTWHLGENPDGPVSVFIHPPLGALAITGPLAVGKTRVAQHLAHQALSVGYDVLVTDPHESWQANAEGARQVAPDEIRRELAAESPPRARMLVLDLTDVAESIGAERDDANGKLAAWLNETLTLAKEIGARVVTISPQIVPNGAAWALELHHSAVGVWATLSTLNVGLAADDVMLAIPRYPTPMLTPVAETGPVRMADLYPGIWRIGETPLHRSTLAINPSDGPLAITGAPGTGKTRVAQHLAHQALTDGYRVLVTSSDSGRDTASWQANAEGMNQVEPNDISASLRTPMGTSPDLLLVLDLDDAAEYIGAEEGDGELESWLNPLLARAKSSGISVITVAQKALPGRPPQHLLLTPGPEGITGSAGILIRPGLDNSAAASFMVPRYPAPELEPVDQTEPEYPTSVHFEDRNGPCLLVRGHDLDRAAILAAVVPQFGELKNEVVLVSEAHYLYRRGLYCDTGETDCEMSGEAVHAHWLAVRPSGVDDERIRFTIISTEERDEGAEESLAEAQADAAARGYVCASARIVTADGRHGVARLTAVTPEGPAVIDMLQDGTILSLTLDGLAVTAFHRGAVKAREALAYMRENAFVYAPVAAWAYPGGE